ncbi:MATE family efflux transporter [Niveibacterium sp. SC-1]|uniref:MATE family efflux transporter n=1 Tax=Niveibacterium sp. SC-1 TaxID=3135646 RepID=UPI0031204134
MTSPFDGKKTPGLVALAWPIFIEQALHIMVGVVDTFMVSHVSDDAVAALGAANQIVVLFIILFSFFAIGSSVVITHHLGAKDREGADRIAATAVGVNTWVGVVVSLLVWFFCEDMLRLMQLNDELLQYAVPFLHLMGGTLFLESMNFSLSAVLRSHMHTREVMLVTLGQNILNFIGNVILLFGLFGAPKMGVVGVALSTVFSRFVACIALWILVGHYTHLKIRARDFFSMSRERIGRILHIGLPAAGENVSWWTAFMTITAFTARMGSTELATQSYTMQVAYVTMLCGIAIGLATEILVGHMIGANRLEDAYKECLRSLRIGLLISVCVAGVAAVLAPHLLGLFTDNAEIIAVGTVLVRMGLILEPGRTFNLIVINALRASGDARFPVLAGMVSQWGVMAFGAWLLGTYFGMGLLGVWIAMTIDEWLRGLAMLHRWKKRKWVKYAARMQVQAKAQSVDPIPSQA